MPLVKKYPEEARRVNVDSIKFIIDNLYNDQKVIGFNTNSGLGNSINGVADETSPMNPVSEYAKQKCEAEKIIMSYPNSVGFRLATCYGLTWRTRLDLLVKGTLNVKLSAAEIKKRLKKWKPKKSMYSAGALWKYAQMVGPASGGAVTHKGPAAY
jgi:nucleoside-diphosphate-sugar epimerase